MVPSAAPLVQDIKIFLSEFLHTKELWNVMIHWPVRKRERDLLEEKTCIFFFLKNISYKHAIEIYNGSPERVDSTLSKLLLDDVMRNTLVDVVQQVIMIIGILPKVV